MTPVSQTTPADTSPGIPADHLQAIRGRIEALRTEVLSLPHEILIPPERHDNRQRYAMFFILDYALAAIDGDETLNAVLTEPGSDAVRSLDAVIHQEEADLWRALRALDPEDARGVIRETLERINETKIGPVANARAALHRIKTSMEEPIQHVREGVSALALLGVDPDSDDGGAITFIARGSG